MIHWLAHITLFILMMPSDEMAFQDENQDKISRMSLMYRRSGQTAKDFVNLSSGDTISYYRRYGNPYFRVYKLRTNLQIDKIELISYQNDDAVSVGPPRQMSMSSGIYSFVDEYIAENEESFKMIITYFDPGSDVYKTFDLYVKLDAEWDF